MRMVINPGTEPVANASEKLATDNMKHFVVDCKRENLRFVRASELDYGEGRFAFILFCGERCHEIQMPGLPLSRVRFMEESEQNAWDFPRLYVDGSSWLWKFALLVEDGDWRTDFAV